VAPQQSQPTIQPVEVADNKPSDKEKESLSPDPPFSSLDPTGEFALSDDKNDSVSGSWKISATANALG
jgi:hypothetical protein